jgi:anti-sigma B factor antagonist
LETAIGVFASRDRAAEAFRELLAAKVPHESIVFLTRSEAEAKTVEKELSSAAKGFMGLSTGIAIALLAVPGIGPVFSLGVGAAASSFLGLIGTGVASKMGHELPRDLRGAKPAGQESANDDAAFFREVLQEGRTLIVVRTESQQTASAASKILDHHGLKMRGPTPPKMQSARRHVGDVVIVDLSGRITLGEGNTMLREIIAELLENGKTKILLTLQEVGYLDSAGLGELVRSYTSVRNRGGQLTLLNPGKRITDLLHMTRLITVFEIEVDEAKAIQSIGRPKESQATA